MTIALTKPMQTGSTRHPQTAQVRQPQVQATAQVNAQVGQTDLLALDLSTDWPTHRIRAFVLAQQADNTWGRG